SHLGRNHAYFQDNWEAFLTEMEILKPDLIIHGGDVSFNGPDVPDDLRYAREQIARLRLPWVAIPGNHDIGEPGNNPRLTQPVTAGWRLVLLKPGLLGGGMAEGRAQWEVRAEALAGAEGGPLGLILHEPLFQMTPDEAEPNGSCVHPGPRRPVLALAREHGVG